MNPVKAARLQKGLTVYELAAVAKVSAGRIRQVERGEDAQLRGPVLSALVKLGYDPEKLVKSYAQWRQAEEKRVLDIARGIEKR